MSKESRLPTFSGFVGEEKKKKEPKDKSPYDFGLESISRYISWLQNPKWEPYTNYNPKWVYTKMGHQPVNLKKENPDVKKWVEDRDAAHRKFEIEQLKKLEKIYKKKADEEDKKKGFI